MGTVGTWLIMVGGGTTGSRTSYCILAYWAMWCPAGMDGTGFDDLGRCVE